MPEIVTFDPVIPANVDVPADQRPLAEPTSDALREFLADRDLGREMLRRYAEEIFPVDLRRWRIRAVEIEWRKELLPTFPRAGSRKRFPLGLDAAGRCDLVVEDVESRTLGIVDHKSAASGHVLADAMLPIDEQGKTYAWGMPEFDGHPVAWFAHNTLIKSVPKPPRLVQAKKKADGCLCGRDLLRNAKGESVPHALSQSRDQVTTLTLYEAAIREHGLDPAPYAEILGLLRAAPRQFFQRSLVAHDAATLAAHEEEMRWIALERADAPAYRTPNKILCPGCPFYAGLCVADTPEGRGNFRVLDEAHVELDEVRPSTGERPIITTSEIAEWKRCHRRHALHYGAGLVPLVDARALRLGTGLHVALADLYRTAMNGAPDPTIAVRAWDAHVESECVRIYGITVAQAEAVVQSVGGASTDDQETPF